MNRVLWLLGCILLAAAFTRNILAGDSPDAASISFTVGETAGLRRFGYPVTASLEATQGTLVRENSARLLDGNGKGLPAQFTVMSRWPDGSVRGLDVDFTSSIGPMETMSYRVDWGDGPPRPSGRGLAVTATGEEIVVASPTMTHKIRPDGKPLLTSVINGQTEYLAAEGITTALLPGHLEVLKRGPFNVTLQLGPVTLEYVSSKSWVKTTQRSAVPARLAVEARFALKEPPVLWDLGVGGWLYGSLRQPTETALLRQSPSGWRVFTGNEEPLSLYALGQHGQGWGHFADKQRVVAFGMADFAAGGEPEFRLGRDGRFRATARRRELAVYFHFVGQPVQVTALTSPPSMLSPLVVKAKEEGPVGRQPHE